MAEYKKLIEDDKEKRKVNFTQAKDQFFSELMQQENCLTKEELVARLGKTTIRCCWVDYTDSLNRDHLITDKQRQNWGQVI